MKISLIIPVFNEEDVLSLLRTKIENLVKLSNFQWEFILINDGSRDKSKEIINQWAKEDSRVMGVNLSRNFGHQAAITAGLAQSNSDAVVIMDADLQDPPEIILDLIKEWQKGFKVVLAVRKRRKENVFKRTLYSLFYSLFSFLVDASLKVDSGVFGLMDKVVVRHILSLEERNRFLPGLRAWVGFKTTRIFFVRLDRSIGTPKISFIKLLKYGMDAIFSFSYRPLRACFILGIIMSAACFIYGFVLIALRIAHINVVSGFTTTTVSIFFVGGLLLISNGLLGEYIARIYDEVKKRPLYIIEEIVKK